MLSLNLQPIFKARGIDKPFSYLTSAGFPSYTAHNLLNAKTVTFRLSHIDKLCSLLNCTPNDLLVWTPNRNQKLADTHPITRLKKQNTDLNWQDITAPTSNAGRHQSICKSGRQVFNFCFANA
jgi:DNA-binding Xre family transcriptional regulator